MAAVYNTAKCMAGISNDEEAFGGGCGAGADRVEAQSGGDAALAAGGSGHLHQGSAEGSQE